MRNFFTLLKGTPQDDFIVIPLLPPSVTTPVDVVAGAGNDTIVVAFAPHANTPSFITVNGGPGDDWIDTYALNSSPSTILAGVGNDTLIGGSAADIIAGGPGNDVIWMGGGDNIFADGHDRLLLDVYAGGGSINLHGATTNTIFDFTSLVPLHLEAPSKPPDPFTIARSDLSFDAAGNLQVDHADPAFGNFHMTLAGSPYHDDTSLNAAISNGHVLL